MMFMNRIERWREQRAHREVLRQTFPEATRGELKGLARAHGVVATLLEGNDTLNRDNFELNMENSRLKSALRESDADKQEANKAAYIDSMTGVGTRLAFDRDLVAFVKRIHREDGSYGLLDIKSAQIDGLVVMIDVTYLKEVNDGQGHWAGDAMIVQMARILESCIGVSYDFKRMINDPTNLGETSLIVPSGIYRVGGDEFILLIRVTTPEARRALEKKLEEAAANTDIRFAWGIASLKEPGVRGDAGSLVRLADERMYEMKAEQHKNINPPGQE